MALFMIKGASLYEPREIYKRGRKSSPPTLTQPWPGSFEGRGFTSHLTSGANVLAVR